jgi:hypothetical protein
VIEQPFRPLVTAAGARHPVTENLPGANSFDAAGNAAAEASWGRWYRALRADARAGTTLMSGPGGVPLMQLDRVGEGRVALLLSDQIWLWSRTHEGGGPQGELLRRIAGKHSVVVVEHDLEFVRALGRKVTVLHEGSVLSEGPIELVQEDPRVIDVYLGR